MIFFSLLREKYKLFPEHQRVNTQAKEIYDQQYQILSLWYKVIVALTGFLTSSGALVARRDTVFAIL